MKMQPLQKKPVLCFSVWFGQETVSGPAWKLKSKSRKKRDISPGVKDTVGQKMQVQAPALFKGQT